MAREKGIKISVPVGDCVFKEQDDFEEIIQKVIAADVLVISLEVYFYSLTAQKGGIKEVALFEKTYEMGLVMDEKENSLCKLEVDTEPGKSMIMLPDGSFMPRLGQGTWGMAENLQAADWEKRALRHGIDLGMTMIDTAETYADGAAEKLVGEAISGMDREKLYLISKVHPRNASRANMGRSIDHSLKRLKTDYLDLYLLHWRGNADLEEAVSLMEELKLQGKIRRWGVSNFDVQDMEDLWKVPGGNQCCVNQVLYNLDSRGIEYDLMGWQRGKSVPFIAYGPVGQAGKAVTESGVSKERLMKDWRVMKLAAEKRISVIQLLLAFVLYQPDMAAIPKAVHFSHLDENVRSIEIRLEKKEIDFLSESFPFPKERVQMEKY